MRTSSWQHRYFKKAFGGLLAGVMMGLSGFPATAGAQAYPGNKPIKMVIPWPAGGVTDAAGRILAKQLSESMSVPVVVENRPGANGLIGADYVAKSAPDGYTLFLATAETHAINPYIYSKLPYDPIKDFVAVAPFAINPFTVTVRSGIPASTMKEAVELAQKSPGKLTNASWGIGSSSQIIMEMVKKQAKVDILHIPFQGEAPAVTALMGDQVDFMVLPAARAESFSKDGRVKVLATTTAERAWLLPDVPTLKEQGYNVDVANWFGLVAPAGTPEDVIDVLNAAVAKLLQGEPLPKALRELGVDMHPVMNPAEFQTFIVNEGKRWGPVIREANIHLD